ncbi:hypothetical protein [Sulfurovum mangrovi]|uniref:hypothetical protein n=1 Tax=Sulfurovum mangrovi TaxID=2893889 RepID=UPI001E4B51BE|nr:hypothetical protein [Sulfurovum mangrovi]UFH58307.1 hypothetical protein LN246_08065 [Sulfurovum mangrovi]
MKSVLVLFGLSASFLVQGCVTESSLVKVECKECDSCTKKCEHKYLIKKDYQRNRSIERCKKRCYQSEL